MFEHLRHLGRARTAALVALFVAVVAFDSASQLSRPHRKPTAIPID
jgi:hypothetical protein